MATEFHLSSIALSVRNFLALGGPATTSQMLERLKEVFHPLLEEDEVLEALGELEKRNMVRMIDGGLRWDVLDRQLYRFRPDPAPAILAKIREGVALDDDEEQSLWEGWH